MTAYAINSGAGWRELVPGEQVVIGDIASSWASVMAWSPQYRTGQGVRVIEESEIPAAKISTGSRIVDRAGKPVRVHDLSDAPPEPVIVPTEISDRQFAQVLAMEGLITPEEALEWVGPGVIPAQLDAAIGKISDKDQRFGAQMLLTGATIFRRDHPMTPLLGRLLGKDGAAIDELWTRAAAL